MWSLDFLLWCRQCETMSCDRNQTSKTHTEGNISGPCPFLRCVCVASVCNVAVGDGLCRDGTSVSLQERKVTESKCHQTDRKKVGKKWRDGNGREVHWPERGGLEMEKESEQNRVGKFKFDITVYFSKLPESNILTVYCVIVRPFLSWEHYSHGVQNEVNR